MRNSLDNIKQFSDIATRKAEIKLEIVKKETEMRYRFQTVAEMLNPVRIFNDFLESFSDKVKSIAEIGSLIFSLFTGNKRRKRRSRA
jgi:hypothetical protein